jgi:hypothetical protein
LLFVLFLPPLEVLRRNHADPQDNCERGDSNRDVRDTGSYPGARERQVPIEAGSAHRAVCAGGGTDIVARALAQKLTESLGQSFVVDNRAGGGGTIGAETTVRAAPDGYTLAMVSGSYAANAAIFKLPYDPVNDITPISLLAETGFMVTLHPSVQAKTIKELIALAKASPNLSTMHPQARAASRISRPSFSISWRAPR